MHCNCNLQARKLVSEAIKDMPQANMDLLVLKTQMFSACKDKSVPLHALKAPGGRGGIAPTHSQTGH
jgi:hypothetical protein